ncbi:hypothetical protein EW026_g4288 [Hermanssonia centrifuga]|uniref:Uncharacterized protein n=1 Tax=Hermanssonia centrifuga TaxID=98765 RepID=A0A4V3XAE3_9APHY|nr:hypothetical protein EW026_g4288 [Hermanssonia centrifuga]
MHPALLTRIVLTAVFVPIGTILCLLPRFTRIALRIACASMGSFGIVLAIALLAHIPAWGDVWERYWIHDGSDWGTSKEKGLSAAFCLLFSTGLASDWFIHSKFGENPDEKWDRYLANYTASLPNDRGRAGTFTPAISLWDRIFGNHRALAPIVQDVLFPTDADLKLPHPSPGQVKLSKQRSVYDKHTLPDLLDAKPRIGFLRKKGTTRVPGAKRNRRAIKFRPLDEEEGLSSSDEDSPLQEKPWKLTTSLSSASTVTLTNSRKVDFEGEKDMDLKPPKRNEIPEYSDYEDDIGNVGKRVVGRDGPNWTPEFIRRHSTRSNQSRSKPSPTASPSPSNTTSQRTVVERQGTPTTPSTSGVPFAAVPATPSLIRAVDRITAAHEALYRSQTSDVGAVSPARETTASPPGDRQQRDKAWDSFWTEVKAKARS